eukprot:4473017-Ditylum_brightwellii.AAC.1
MKDIKAREVKDDVVAVKAEAKEAKAEVNQEVKPDRIGTSKEVTKELSKAYTMSLFKDDDAKKAMNASISSIKAKKE